MVNFKGLQVLSTELAREVDELRSECDTALAKLAKAEAEVADARGMFLELKRHAIAEGNSYQEDEFGAGYVVNTRAANAEANLAKAREALKFTRQQVVYLGAHTTVGVDYITGPIDAVLSEIKEPHNG